MRKYLEVSNIIRTFALEIKKHYCTTNQNKLKIMVKVKIVNNEGWVFNESTRRLEKWVAEKCYFTLGSSLIEYHGTIGGKLCKIKANNLTDELRVFDSPKDFKEGKVARCIYENVFDSYIFKRSVPVVLKKDDDGYETFHAYIFNDGQAVFADVTGMSCEYDYKERKFKSDKVCYSSESSVYEYNDFQILNEDGSVTTKKSLKTILAFNDEQKALIDELGTLLDKLNNSGVLVVYDREYEKLCVFKDIVRLTDNDGLEDDEICVSHMAHNVRDMEHFDDYCGAVIKNVE